MDPPKNVTPSVDALIEELAGRQHGLVTRQQLLRAGIGRAAVRHRIAGRRLRPVHRGVYRMGPLVSPREAAMAAVLACGAGAVVSHRTATTLWALLAAGSGPVAVDVTVPAGARPRRPGIRVHRSDGLDPCHVTVVDGVPTTTPARTLLDLAGCAEPRDLERAVARAEREALTERGDLLALLDRYPRSPGGATLRRLLGGPGAPALTRSEAEARFLALIRKAQLPGPAVNAAAEGYEVDFLWREQGVVVEVDGFAFHSSRSRFEADRRRDARFSARGLRVVRVTWNQILEEPEATVVRVAQTLAVAQRG